MANRKPTPKPENIRPHQFKPGQAGNPDGYSRGRRITDHLLDLIADKKAGGPLASVWLSQALKGNFAFFRELLDRTEGPIQPAVQETGFSVIDVVAEAEKRANKRKRKRKTDGPPGGLS